MRRDPRGFTLVELLVVIAIIGILAAIGLATFGAPQIKARVAATRALIQKTESALKNYYTHFDAYPPSSGTYAGSANLHYFLGSPLRKVMSQSATGDVDYANLAPLMKWEAADVKTGQVDPGTTPQPLTDAWKQDVLYANPGQDHTAQSGRDHRQYVDIESPGFTDGEGNKQVIANWRPDQP